MKAEERKRFLLVEDNPEHSELIQTYIELTTFRDAEVRVTGTLKEGLSLLNDLSFDLVLLDLSLPDSDIVATMESIPTLGEYAPVIVLTSLDDTNTILEIINKGADDCLPKIELKDTLLERSIRFTLDRWTLKRKLQASERNYQDLYDNSPELRVSVDAKTAKVLVCNQTAADKLGYSKQEIIGNPVFSVYHPDSLEGANKAFKQFASTGIVKNAELQLQKKSGEKIDVLLNVTSVRDAQGNALYSRSSWTDITEEKKLRGQLEIMQQALDSVNEAAYLIDESSCFRYVNEQACLDLRYSAAELLQMKVCDIDPDFPAENWPTQWEEMKRVGSVTFESRHKTKQGKGFPVELNVRFVEHHGEEMVLALVRDISERRNTENMLRQAASVFIHAGEGIVITDEQGTIVDVNTAFTEITGYTSAEVVGKNPSLLQSGCHDKAFYEAMWQMLAKKDTWHGEVWNRKKSGEVYAQMLTISAVQNENGAIKNYVGLFSDITQMKAQQNKLEHLAHYDPLTKLPNRVLLADRLQQEMSSAVRREEHLAVTYLDLDGFKEINDQHGHDVGDILLTKFAERLKASSREEDTIARIGGDEFIAVFPALSKFQDCYPLLDRLLKVASKPVLVKGTSLSVSASLGVAFFPQENPIDPDQLLRQADHAMYEAKQAGKNLYKVFDVDQDRIIRGHHEYVQKIRSALSNNEFVLHFQPKVNMRTGETIGVEALIRWRQADNTLLQPGQFLPLVQNDHVGVEIDEWVIETAIAQFGLWQAEGLEIVISINLNALTLLKAGFQGRLEDSLKRSGVHNRFIELEVLETSALDDIDRVSQVIVSCQNAGINFALDDFGSGYSSLIYLKRLPAHTLKIDQTFVRDMLEDPDDLAILEGVLGMSAAFRRNVVAEGAETEEHCEMLLQLGCDFAQGYGIARPMPEKSIPSWIRNWHPNPRWRDLPRISPEDHALLFATIQHRAWIKHVRDFVDGTQDRAPELDVEKCPFGKWLRGEALGHVDSLPSFQALFPLHDEIHVTGKDICDLHKQGKSKLVAKRMDDLLELRDRLVSLLKQLLNEYQSSH